MSVAAIIIAIAIIFYFVKQKPYNDDQEKAGQVAARIAKRFGSGWIDAVEFECDDSSKDRVFVIFKDDGFRNPKQPYEVIETIYKSDSKRARNRKYEYSRMVLQKLPYEKSGFSGSAYPWDQFIRFRQEGILQEMYEEEREKERKEYERNRINYYE